MIRTFTFYDHEKILGENIIFGQVETFRLKQINFYGRREIKVIAFPIKKNHRNNLGWITMRMIPFLSFSPLWRRYLQRYATIIIRRRKKHKKTPKWWHWMDDKEISQNGERNFLNLLAKKFSFILSIFREIRKKKL